MSPRTRVVSLEAGQVRGRGINRGTTAMPMVPPWLASPPSFKTLIAKHYPAMHRSVLRADHPGVALTAIDLVSDQVAGSVWIAGKPGEVNTAIIGRHDRADLFLDDEEAMSLRHVALVVHPLTAWDRGGVTYRLIDLRTQFPLVDEHGRRFDALEASGPIFVFAGRYALVCLVTGAAEDWPEDPKEAWATVPPRVYESHVPAREQRSWTAAPPEASVVRTTYVTLMHAPAFVPERPLCDDDEPRLGTVTVTSGDRLRRHSLGARLARRGMLIGSYPRCDDGVIGPDVGVSRVHLFLTLVGERLWAVDASSTNGTFVGEDAKNGDRLRQLALDQQTTLALAGGASVIWTPE